MGKKQGNTDLKISEFLAPEEGQKIEHLPNNLSYTWVFPKIGEPQNGWFIMENTLLKWMIWGEHPLLSETST